MVHGTAAGWRLETYYTCWDLGAASLQSSTAFARRRRSASPVALLGVDPHMACERRCGVFIGPRGGLGGAPCQRYRVYATASWHRERSSRPNWPFSRKSAAAHPKGRKGADLGCCWHWACLVHLLHRVCGPAWHGQAVAIRFLWVLCRNSQAGITPNSERNQELLPGVRGMHCHRLRIL